jgi:hypothetical protein
MWMLLCDLEKLLVQRAIVPCELLQHAPQPPVLIRHTPELGFHCCHLRRLRIDRMF